MLGQILSLNLVTQADERIVIESRGFEQQIVAWITAVIRTRSELVGVAVPNLLEKPTFLFFQY